MTTLTASSRSLVSHLSRWSAPPSAHHQTALQVIGDVGPVHQRIEPVPLAVTLPAELVLEELHRLGDADTERNLTENNRDRLHSNTRNYYGAHTAEQR